jgi:hypothetical protein
VVGGFFRVTTQRQTVRYLRLESRDIQMLAPDVSKQMNNDFMAAEPGLGNEDVGE